MGKESVTFLSEQRRKNEINLRMLKAILPTACRWNRLVPKQSNSIAGLRARKSKGEQGSGEEENREKLVIILLCCRCNHTGNCAIIPTCSF